MKSISNVNVDAIKIEYLYGKDSSGRLNTLQGLAHKYDIPVSSLSTIANKTDFEGRTWAQSRALIISNIDKKVQNQIEIANTRNKIKLVKKISNIADLALDNLEQKLMGYNPITKGYDDKKKLVLSPSQIEKLIKLQYKLLGDNGINSIEKVITLKSDKDISNMSRKELNELEKAINADYSVEE